jgi:DNA-binding response OmpR family regulator
LRHPTNNQLIRLNDKENMVLKYLFRAGASIDRLTLLSEVWGDNSATTTQTVEAHIYRLRQKIEADPSNPRLLVDIIQRLGPTGLADFRALRRISSGTKR